LFEELQEELGGKLSIGDVLRVGFFAVRAFFGRNEARIRMRRLNYSAVVTKLQYIVLVAILLDCMRQPTIFDRIRTTSSTK